MAVDADTKVIGDDAEGLCGILVLLVTVVEVGVVATTVVVLVEEEVYGLMVYLVLVDSVCGNLLLVCEYHGFGLVMKVGGFEDGFVHDIYDGCCVELCQCGLYGYTLFESM